MTTSTHIKPRLVGGVFLVLLFWGIYSTRDIPNEADLLPGSVMVVDGEIVQNHD